MNLSGRTAYRSTTARCPGCGEPLREESIHVGDEGTPAPEALVDVCDACGGLWLDWFDGDLHALAAGAEAARQDRGTAPPRSEPPTAAPECPRCARSLALDLVRFPDAREGELVEGVEILRCAECAGSFVGRSSAFLLLDRARDPRRPGLWEALVAWLARQVKAAPDEESSGFAR